MKKDSKPDEVTFEKLAAAYRQHFSTPIGEQIIEDLEAAFHINRTTFRAEEVLASNAMAVREGERSVVLYIKNMMAWEAPATSEEEAEHE